MATKAKIKLKKKKAAKMSQHTPTGRIKFLEAQVKLLEADMTRFQNEVLSKDSKIESLRKMNKEMRARYSKMEDGIVAEKHASSLSEAIAKNEVIELGKDTTDGEE